MSLLKKYGDHPLNSLFSGIFLFLMSYSFFKVHQHLLEVRKISDESYSSIREFVIKYMAIKDLLVF